MHGLISFTHYWLQLNTRGCSNFALERTCSNWNADRWLQNHCVTMRNCIAIFNNIMWLNCKVVQSVEKVLKNEKPFFFSLACHTAKYSKTQKQMSVKVISWGHKIKKKKKGTAEVFFFFLFCAKHASSLAARAANTRCLRLVLHQLCLGGHHQHRGTYASIFFHLHHTVLHPSVGDDSAAASWDWLLPHKVGFHLVILFIVPYILIGWSYFSCDFQRWSVRCGQ